MTSTCTVTGLASVMLTVAGVNVAVTPAGGLSSASVTPPVRPSDGVSVSGVALGLVEADAVGRLVERGGRSCP